MFLLGVSFFILGLVFAVRWFSEHKFEYLDGVKPSEQLDQNFWLSMGFMCPALILMAVGLL